MLISVHDKTLSRVTFLDNEKPKTLHYFDDTWHRYLTEATSTFDFSILKTGHPDIEFLTEKGYVSFHYEGKSYLFNIMKVEETEKKLTCYCENLNLELLNETSPEYKATGAKTFAQYINLLGLQYAQLEIGINEVSDLSRSLEWTGQDTKLARLLSLVNKFDAECEFVTHLNKDGTLDKIVLNVYRKHDDSHQGVGTRRKDVTLYYGKEIKEIRRTVDKTGLYTAIKPIGTDGLNISTLDKTELDEDGNVLFRSPKGDTHILCPALRDEYPSQVVDPTGDRYINLDWTYETKNVNTLYGQALAKLKSVYMPAITYEVDGFIQLEIGDTIKIHDNGFAPLLLLEARVSEQEISFSKPDRNKTTFANFRALENKLSADIQSRLEALIQDAIPYTADIITTNGLVFKNGEGSTTLTARVSRGNTILTSLFVQWYKDGTPLSEENSITVNASDVDEKAVYRFEVLDAGGEIMCFAEVTIVDVSDGADGNPGRDGEDGTPGTDGKSSYTHIRYAMDAQGTGMTDKPSLWESSGRNLLLNSKPSSLTGWTASNSSTHSLVNTGEVLPLPSGATHCIKNVAKWNLAYEVMNNVTLETGKKYTLSMYVYIPSSSTSTFNLVAWYANQGWKGIGAGGVITERDTWVKKSFTFTSNNTYPAHVIGMGTANAIAGNYFYVCLAKLEVEDVATPWTPAPEDYPEDWVQPYIGIATTDSEVAPVDASAYTWSKYVGKDGKDGTDGKDGAPGTDGKDGQNPIVGELSLNPIPLLATSTGTVLSFADAKGNFRVYDGKALLTSGVTYSLVSASGVTASINATTGAYTVTAMPQGTDFGTAIFKAAYNGVETQKILSVIKSKQGDTGPRGETGPTGNDGAKGDPTGITVSDTEPTTKYMGMLWKHTGTVSGLVKNATYRWTGTAWELYMFIAKNLQVDNLAAISANLGTITAGTINGVEINGSYITGNGYIALRKPLDEGEYLDLILNEAGLSITKFNSLGNNIGSSYITTTDVGVGGLPKLSSIVDDISKLESAVYSLFTKVVASGRVTVTSTSATWLAIADVPNYSSSNKYFVLANCLTEAIIPYVRSEDGKIAAYGPTIKSGSSYTVDYVVIQR
jgi:phage minor structural protein